MYSRVCHSMVCSIIIRKVAIWSTQDLSCLKPACSSLNSLSSSFILFKIMLQRILLGMNSNIMPLQFLHRDLSPFLGNFTSSPLSQSSGICSSFQILFRSWCRIWIDVSSKHIMASGGILSTPPAFPFWDFFIALMISALVMAFVLMFNVGSSSFLVDLLVEVCLISVWNGLEMFWCLLCCRHFLLLELVVQHSFSCLACSFFFTSLSAVLYWS